MPIINRKFQVTIPKKFKLAIGLKPGDEIGFELADNNTALILYKK